MVAPSGQPRSPLVIGPVMAGELDAMMELP